MKLLQDLFYAFHDEFAFPFASVSRSLERLSPDSRLRSRFFCGGKGAKGRSAPVTGWSVTVGNSLGECQHPAQPIWSFFASWLGE